MGVDMHNIYSLFHGVKSMLHLHSGEVIASLFSILKELWIFEVEVVGENKWEKQVYCVLFYNFD
jgi:hypothetical protein